MRPSCRYPSHPDGIPALHWASALSRPTNDKDWRIDGAGEDLYEKFPMEWDIRIANTKAAFANPFGTGIEIILRFPMADGVIRLHSTQACREWASGLGGIDPGASNVAIIDMNGDGLDDVVVSSSDSPWRVYFNRGDNEPGKGLEPTPVEWGTVPGTLGVSGNAALMDVDGDSLPDALVSQPADGETRWPLYRNLGTGYV